VRIQKGLFLQSQKWSQLDLIQRIPTAKSSLFARGRQLAFAVAFDDFAETDDDSIKIQLSKALLESLAILEPDAKMREIVWELAPESVRGVVRLKTEAE
jgi:hypothetical protein